MRVFVALILLALFVFLSCSSGAVYIPSPLWQCNISNLVKHTDLVVLGKVTGMKVILLPGRKCSTYISIRVESVIKGDKVVEDDTLRFMVWGDVGVETYRPDTPTVCEFTSNERVLLFLNGSDDDYALRLWTRGKVTVNDNQVLFPYTFERKIFSEQYNEMGEIPVESGVELPLDLVVTVAEASIKDYEVIPVESGVELPLDLVVTVAKAAIKDYKAIEVLEKKVAISVSDMPVEDRPKVTAEFYKWVEEKAEQILEKEPEDKQ